MTTSQQPFAFPPYHSFPALYTTQPNATTEASRLNKWSSLILSYCRHNRLFKLVLVDAIDSPLFNNSTINRRLALEDATGIINSMVKGGRAEWSGTTRGKETGKEKAWIYWKTKEEWAGVIYDWVISSTCGSKLFLLGHFLTMA